MSDTLKLVSGVAAALLVGLIVGYIVGLSGKRDVQEQMALEKKKNSSLTLSLKEYKEEAHLKAKEAQANKKLLMARESFLRGIIELLAHNYGLTSQHLDQARQNMKKALKDLNPPTAKKVEILIQKIAAAQTLVLRYDPMARVEIEKILDGVRKIR